MQNAELLNEILSKIEFKIQTDQNIRKEYIYRIKKKIYKIFKNAKKFINSNTILKNITKDEKEVINKLINDEIEMIMELDFRIHPFQLPQRNRFLSTRRRGINNRDFGVHPGLLCQGCTHSSLCASRTPYCYLVSSFSMALQ